MTIRTVAQARIAIRQQSVDGPPFDVGMCKQKTREAYGVPSDGSRDATTAWYRTDQRIGPVPWVPGALAWWTGGTNGDGHVAVLDLEPGRVLSVDIERPGYWDNVTLGTISRRWPALRFVGYSLDIDGVQVAYPPVVIPNTPAVDHAIDDLAHAIAARKPSPARRLLRTARQAAIEARRIIRGRA